MRRRVLLGVVAAVLAAAACDDEPGFNEPSLGDFVQDVEPNPGETLDQNKLGNVGITVLLNFFPAETFGFGALRSFRVDGDDVTDDVAVTPSGERPPLSATLSYQPGDLGEGGHDVEVEYFDSRGIVYRVRWDFTVQN